MNHILKISLLLLPDAVHAHGVEDFLPFVLVYFFAFILIIYLSVRFTKFFTYKYKNQKLRSFMIFLASLFILSLVYLLITAFLYRLGIVTGDGVLISPLDW